MQREKLRLEEEKRQELADLEKRKLAQEEEKKQELAIIERRKLAQEEETKRLKVGIYIPSAQERVS